MRRDDRERVSLGRGVSRDGVGVGILMQISRLLD